MEPLIKRALPKLLIDWYKFIHALTLWHTFIRGRHLTAKSRPLVIGECVNLSISERILVVLGWIALVVVLSTVGAVVLTIVASILFDYQFGVSLTLLAIVVITGGIVLSYHVYDVFQFEKDMLRFFPPKVLICPYCNMKNSTDSTFCLKCGKALPESRLRKLQRTETNTDQH